MEGNKEIMKRALYFLVILVSWETLSNWFSVAPFKFNLESSFLSLSETNYMLNIGYLVFSQLSIPLLLMIGILMLGLFITIKIIKNEC